MTGPPSASKPDSVLLPEGGLWVEWRHAPESGLGPSGPPRVYDTKGGGGNR